MSRVVTYQMFPRTEAPESFVEQVADVLEAHISEIGTAKREKGLTSDQVLGELRADLTRIGFDVEGGKRAEQKIHRPVFYGENGDPVLKYEVDAFHAGWRCGLEVEAGRAWMGNAIYRDLIQALVMVEWIRLFSR